jgi:hypothetical protein
VTRIIVHNYLPKRRTSNADAWSPEARKAAAEARQHGGSGQPQKPGKSAAQKHLSEAEGWNGLAQHYRKQGWHGEAKNAERQAGKFAKRAIRAHQASQPPGQKPWVG